MIDKRIFVQFGVLILLFSNLAQAALLGRINIKLKATTLR
jgi:hypothetical protein